MSNYVLRFNISKSRRSFDFISTDRINIDKPYGYSRIFREYREHYIKDNTCISLEMESVVQGWPLRLTENSFMVCYLQFLNNLKDPEFRVNTYFGEVYFNLFVPDYT